MTSSSLYRVTDRDILDADWFNRLLGDVNARLRAIEAIRTSLESAIADLTKVGLDRIDQAVSPLIQGVEASVAAVQAEVADVIAQIEQLLSGAVPAASVSESPARVFVSPAQRQQIADNAAQILQLADVLAPKANAVLSGVVRISNALRMTGAIDPPALTADVNDYAPADFATAVRVRLSATGERSITGLVAAEDGRAVILENMTAFDLTLKAQSTASVAANRFAAHADVVVPKSGGAVSIMYDITLQRWAVTGGGKIADLKVGDLLETMANPGATFLRTNAALYLNSAYPTLRAILGAYQNPIVNRLGTAGSNAPRLYYLNGQWVAFAYIGTAWGLYTSPDLLTWTPRTMPVAGAPGSGLVYGAGLYAWTDGSTTLKTSPDLNTWTTRALPSGVTNIGSVARGATKFVATATKTGGVAGAIYSTDGVTWTLSASTFGYSLSSVAYNSAGGRWVITASGGKIFRSTDDAVTWAETGSPLAATASVTSAGGVFIALLTVSPWAYISADGQTWTAASAAYAAGTSSAQPSSVSYDGAAFVFSHYASNILARSADLVNWTFLTATGVTGDISAVFRTGSTANDAYVLAAPAGVLSGLDMSTTQFQVPLIAGRTSNSQVYIKAL